MRKQVMANRWSVVILTLAVIGILAGNIWAGCNRFSSLTVSIERFITADGIIYDLHDDDQTGTDWLRKISPEGRLLEHISFPKTENNKYMRRNIVDVVNDVVYLYEIEYESAVYTALRETVMAYDLKSGNYWIIYPKDEQVSETDVVEHYASRRIWDNSFSHDYIYIGYLYSSNGSGSEADNSELELEVRRLDIFTGEMTTRSRVKLSFVPIYFHVTSEEDILAATPDSKIWLYDGEWKIIFNTEGLEAISNISIGADGSAYAFLTDGNSRRLMRKTPASDYFSPVSTPFPRALTVEVSEDKTWLAVNADSDSSRQDWVTSKNGQINSFEQLTAQIYLIWMPLTLLSLLIEILLAVFIVLLVRHVYLRRKMKLIVKQVIAALSIFTAGTFFLFDAISQQTKEKMYKITYDELLLQASEIAERIDEERFTHINWNSPLTDEYYLELDNMFSSYSLSKNIYWYNSTSEEQDKTQYFFSYWLFRVDEDKENKENQVYVAICDDLYINLESRYIDKDEHYQNMINTALINQLPTKERTFDSAGEGYWLSVLYPISDGEGIVGLIEVARPSVHIDNEVEIMMANIFPIVLCVLGLSLLACIAVLKFFLGALDKLKLGAQAIAEGNYGARVQVTTADETEDVAAAFNRMADSVEESDRNIRVIRDSYRKFVPEKMLSILGKESIAQVGPGSYAHLRGTNLLLSTDSFEIYRDKVFFDALNLFYACVIPHLTKAGGVIERYAGRGLAAIFDEPPETALNALIDMFADLDLLNVKLRAEGFIDIECRALLSFSDSLLGVIGTDKRLNMIAVSRMTYESERVGLMCKRYGCRIILTQTSCDELGGSLSKYRHRLLGYIIRSEERLPVYDFYDSDVPELMRGKDETRNLFEEAVGYYYAANYAAARRLFIEVIKKSPRDLAAREYLKESHYHLESGQPPTMLLEI